MDEKSGFQIAVERIEEVARTNKTHLDLSGLSLTRVPDDLVYDPQILRAPKKIEYPAALLTPSRQLQVTIVYSASDKEKVRDFYNLLGKESWMKVWLDEGNFLPGLDWDSMYMEAVRQSDVVIIFFSNTLISKENSIQKIIRTVYDTSDEKPEDSGFVIPVRLDDCQIPGWLRDIQYGDYFPEENQEITYQRVLESLKLRGQKLSILAPDTILSPKPLPIFLCHVKEDSAAARAIYQQLNSEGWIDVWFDEINILPGMSWQLQIRNAIYQAEVAIVCMSTNSATKDGYFARELSLLLDKVNEVAEGRIFIIPLRVDESEVPHKLQKWHYVDYFSSKEKTLNYYKLLQAIKIRAASVIPDRFRRRNINLRSLDLSSNELVRLPDDFGQFTSLETLQLAGNQLHNLSSEFEQLIGLRELNLNNNLFYRFTKEDIDKLVYVSFLSLENNGIKSLPPEIGQLVKLRKLHLNKNNLSDLPREVGLLTNLDSIDLSHNDLTNLPSEIGLLTNLTSLDISYNQLANLVPEIGRLSKLSSFNLSHNQFTNPPLALRNITSLEELDIRDNPLAVPPEILEKVNDPKLITNYLVEIWAGQRRPLSETKMLVVGQGSVGKTSLIRRLTNNTFSSSEIKTDGIAINRWQVPNSENGENQPEVLRVNIWDFGGQEIMHATHQFFLTRRSLYLLVLDSRISQEENRVEYWLKIIESYGGESPVLIIGNKTDQHPLDIDDTGLKKKYPNIVGIIKTSAAKGTGLEELKTIIAKQVNKLPHVRDSLPEVWFNVKNQLELLGHVQNYISQEKYAETCVEGEIRDEISQRTLIGFLHDLGVVLHFQDDPHLESLGILNPQWVTNGVYKILNARDILDNKGVMTLTMLNAILDSPEYPSDKRLFIVEMMRKFELCYDIDRDKFLVPDLLPKSEPFVGEKEWEGALAFQYQYNVLPSSIITRFIVRMNELIHKTVWRSGVVLKKDDNTALVKADTEERKIYIWVNGAENTRRDFLSVIRAEFDAIHKTIIKIEATEKVPVPDHPETEPIPFAMLLQAEREGRSTIPVMADGRLIDVNVRELLNGVRVGEAPTPMIERVAPSAPVAVTEQKPEAVTVPATQLSTPVKILRWVFVEFPKIVGRIPLDIVGKGKDAADSTLVSLGYGIIILLLLVVFGYVGFDALITMAKDIWRFFFPVKP